MKLRQKTLLNLQKMKPKEWNNIPICLQEAVTELIKFSQSINKTNLEQEFYMCDLALVLQNVFHFSEMTSDDMRAKVHERIKVLNGKGESELTSLKDSCNKYSDHNRKVAIDEAGEEARTVLDKIKRELFNELDAKMSELRRTI